MCNTEIGEQMDWSFHLKNRGALLTVTTIPVDDLLVSRKPLQSESNNGVRVSLCEPLFRGKRSARKKVPHRYHNSLLARKRSRLAGVRTIIPNIPAENEMYDRVQTEM